MKARTLLALTGAVVALPLLAFCQDQAARPEWDQKKAAEKVQKVIALEETGRPWDRIAWMTDAEAAVTRARKESKPIFIYFFLKKNIGPAAAPC